MKKNQTTIILIFLFVIIPLVIIGIHHRGAQERQQRIDEMIRYYERYQGATGETITIFDSRTDRWIAEMKEESVEIILGKLTDAAEYVEPGFGVLFSVGTSLWSDESRERTVYGMNIEAILSNRRFRKVYEDLQKINEKEATGLLTKNIQDNLTELRIMLQEHKEMVSRGKHKGTFVSVMWRDEGDTYRLMSSPNHPPTRFGRRYAVLSYIVLASLLELQDVRPVIEEVIAFAMEEYKLFNSINEDGTGSFKSILLKESLYNPSLLLTATLCDPEWNAEKHKLLEEKLVKDREVVDWQSRSLEHDMPGREGWVPVKPHESMIKVRYYKDITDAEFNDFFGK